MSSFKKLSRADVTVVPYHANKQWNVNIDCFPTSSDYLTIYKGTNVTGSFSLGGDPINEGQYERLIYTQINHLFYQEYTASLDTGSLIFTLNNYESASQQRPTASYFIYNDNKNFVNNFPTGANASIRVIAINQDIYGNKVLPNSFVLTSSAYSVTDDGYGNVKDGSTHIGNIFYAHGLVVVTNPDYQLMFPTSSCIPTTTTTTTSTTSTTTTPVPTTTTTTTSTTSTTTTEAPTTTTSTTTTTTTAEPTTTTSTTTTTTTEPTTTTTTSTTTTTTTPTPTTSTTTTTTTAAPVDVYLVYRIINNGGGSYDTKFTLSNTAGDDSPGSQITVPFDIGTSSGQYILYSATCGAFDASGTWYLLAGNSTTTKSITCNEVGGFSVSSVQLNNPPFTYNVGGGYYEYTYLGTPYRIYITPPV